MPVDLSGSIYDQYLKACLRAKESARIGNLADVAAAYRQAGELMRQYANFTRDPNVRKQRLKKAVMYERAAHVKAKGLPTAESKIQKKPDLSMQESDLDDYEAEVMSLIFQTNIRWDDIGGLEETKRQVKTAYVMALAKKPEGVELNRLDNILLYGPPGTGKTLLAAATAGNLEATFFNVKVSNLLSKYFGESTKLISALFKVARKLSPSVIFLDEFESLTPTRGSGESGAERRIVSTLLSELDGFSSKENTNFVMTMVATNVPWLLDVAIISRFQQRIYVPLPDKQARKSILEILLIKKGFQSEVSIKELVEKTEGFSGRDIEQLSTMAVSHMVQTLNPKLVPIADKGLETVRDYEIKIGNICMNDFEYAFRNVKPIVDVSLLNKYIDWSQHVLN